MGLIIPFPLSSTANKETLSLLINEHGWVGEAVFRETCAVPRFPREKPVSFPVAGGLPMSPSTRKLGLAAVGWQKKMVGH